MSSLAPTIGYRDRSDHPWPRILQLIAIVTLIYAAARIGSTISDLRRIWPVMRLGGVTVSHAEYVTWIVGDIIGVIIDLALIVGAIQFFRRGSERLILVALWAIIIHYIVSFMVGMTLRSQSQTLLLFSGSISYAIRTNTYPVVVILLLRAYRVR